MSGMRNIDARNIGLRNIVVADTRICSIDGEHGELIYRGYDILDLVTHSTFEETAYLLLFGDLPTKDELAEFTLDLKENREIPDALYRNLKNRPLTASPMDVLQSCVSQLPDYDLDVQDDSREMNIKRAKMLISKIPTIVAVWDRIRSGKEIIKNKIIGLLRLSRKFKSSFFFLFKFKDRLIPVVAVPADILILCENQKTDIIV